MKTVKPELTEEEMRRALFGSDVADPPPSADRAAPDKTVSLNRAVPNKRKADKSFVARLKVTLRVGNEFEGKTEVFTFEADTLSALQAEVDATKAARKKFRYIALISIERMK